MRRLRCVIRQLHIRTAARRYGMVREEATYILRAALRAFAARHRVSNLIASRARTHAAARMVRRGWSAYVLRSKRTCPVAWREKARWRTCAVMCLQRVWRAILARRIARSGRARIMAAVQLIGRCGRGMLGRAAAARRRACAAAMWAWVSPSLPSESYLPYLASPDYRLIFGAERLQRATAIIGGRPPQAGHTRNIIGKPMPSILDGAASAVNPSTYLTHGDSIVLNPVSDHGDADVAVKSVIITGDAKEICETRIALGGQRDDSDLASVSSATTFASKRLHHLLIRNVVNGNRKVTGSMAAVPSCHCPSFELVAVGISVSYDTALEDAAFRQLTLALDALEHALIDAERSAQHFVIGPATTHPRSTHYTAKQVTLAPLTGTLAGSHFERIYRNALGAAAIDAATLGDVSATATRAALGEMLPASSLRALATTFSGVPASRGVGGGKMRVNYHMFLRMARQLRAVCDEHGALMCPACTLPGRCGVAHCKCLTYAVPHTVRALRTGDLRVALHAQLCGADGCGHHVRRHAPTLHARLVKVDAPAPPAATPVKRNGAACMGNAAAAGVALSAVLAATSADGEIVLSHRRGSTAKQPATLSTVSAPALLPGTTRRVSTFIPALAGSTLMIPPHVDENAMGALADETRAIVADIRAGGGRSLHGSKAIPRIEQTVVAAVLPGGLIVPLQPIGAAAIQALDVLLHTDQRHGSDNALSQLSCVSMSDAQEGTSVLRGLLHVAESESSARTHAAVTTAAAAVAASDAARRFENSVTPLHILHFTARVNAAREMRVGHTGEPLELAVAAIQAGKHLSEPRRQGLSTSGRPTPRVAFSAGVLLAARLQIASKVAQTKRVGGEPAVVTNGTPVVLKHVTGLGPTPPVLGLAATRSVLVSPSHRRAALEGLRYLELLRLLLCDTGMHDILNDPHALVTACVEYFAHLSRWWSDLVADVRCGTVDGELVRALLTPQQREAMATKLRPDPARAATLMATFRALGFSVSTARCVAASECTARTPITRTSVMGSTAVAAMVASALTSASTDPKVLFPVATSLRGAFAKVHHARSPYAVQSIYRKCAADETVQTSTVPENNRNAAPKIVESSKSDSYGTDDRLRAFSLPHTNDRCTTVTGDHERQQLVCEFPGCGRTYTVLSHATEHAISHRRAGADPPRLKTASRNDALLAHEWDAAGATSGVAWWRSRERQ